MRKVLKVAGEILRGRSDLVKKSMQVVLKATNYNRRVVVSSNCQTGGIAASLQVIFPEDEIIPLPLPAFACNRAEIRFAEKISKCDIWVSIGGYDLPEKFGFADQVQLIRVPILRFSGFHPDLVYARQISTGELIVPHYNSAIAIWAYQNKLEIDDAEKLFNKNTFTELGYLDHWGPSVNQLAQRFENSDLKFSDFILSMRREGLFMYSLNHPKLMAIARLSKLVARKMGAGADVFEKYIDINDGLNDVIWPVYPEIGDSLSLYSSYSWKMGEGQWIKGIRSYLEYAYESYAQQNIAPSDIVSVQIDEHRYNQVLGNCAGIRT